MRRIAPAPPHRAEARLALGPVHRGDVEEQVEAAVVLERSHRLEQPFRLDLEHQDAVRHGRLAGHPGQALADPFEGGVAHGQNFSLTMGWRSPAMRSCPGDGDRRRPPDSGFRRRCPLVGPEAVPRYPHRQPQVHEPEALSQEYG